MNWGTHFQRFTPPFLIISLLIVKFLVKLKEHIKVGKYKIKMELGLS